MPYSHLQFLIKYLMIIAFVMLTGCEVDSIENNGNSGENTGNIIEEDTNVADEEGSGDNTEEGLTDSTEEEPTDNTEEEPTDNTEEGPTDNTEEGPTDNTEEGPTDNTEEEADGDENSGEADAQSTALEDAISSGELGGVTELELLDATLAELALKQATPSLLTALYGSDPIDYTPTQRTQIISTIHTWTGDRLIPILVGNQGNILAAAGTTDMGRYAAFGMAPTKLFQNGSSLGYEMPFNRLLAWLLADEPIDMATLDADRSIALSFAKSDSSNITDWIAAKHPGWTVTDCNVVSELASCYANSDLVITGWQGSNDDAGAIRQALETVVNSGKPLLYLHTEWEGQNEVSEAIGNLLGFSLPYGGNWWAEDAASWTDVGAMHTDYYESKGFGAIKKMLEHFKAQDYAFDWSACDGGNCSGVAGLKEEFQNGADAVHTKMTNLDETRFDLFAEDNASLRLYRLLVLLGDKYRQAVQFPMDKITTDDTVFLKSLFADHAVYNYRAVNPAQPDMGNFSRSDFSHITSLSKIVDMESKVYFRSAGVYALPGQTVHVTRLDTSELGVKVFVNSLRSGATHQWQENGYKRPKYLQSPQMEIMPGETIAFTSPYGGPLQVRFSDNDLPVQLRFENVGEHPYWRGSEDDASFSQKLAAGDYDWAELATPTFEVHSKLDKMRESVDKWGTATDLATATQRYIHNIPHVLAGLQGQGIDVVPEIHDFADSNGWSIDTQDKVKHMNADQASCGYGCSGNPYDAYWSFNPLNQNDLHELGHGLESGRFRFNGFEWHSTTDPYSFYTKSRYNRDTGGNNTSCNGLPFDSVFDKLQQSFGQTDPKMWLKTNLWADSNWSQQVLFTIQMMMNAEEEGVLDNGWHMLARMHLLEREFNRARRSETDWTAKRDSMGFSEYSLGEANNIDNNDWLVIVISYVTGLDYRDFINTWGHAFSQKASAQVAGFGYPAAPVRFFVSEPKAYCEFNANGDFLDKPFLPIDGSQ